ncbi:uroporphyrinogen-III synthase [Enterococcus sp. LJL99]
MKTILLTRLISDNHEDRCYFEEKNYFTLEIPLVTLKKRVLKPNEIKEMEQSEWIFLTSQHAAEFFIDLKKEHDLYSKKYAVIGKKTGQVLLDNGFSIDYQAPVATKRELFEKWRTLYPAPKTIFYPKSNLADSLGEAAFLQAGYQFSTAVLYDNYFSEQSQKILRNALMTKKIDAVYLASPSLWQRFLYIFKEIKTEKMPTLYCIGATTEKAIQKDGYSVSKK